MRRVVEYVFDSVKGVNRALNKDRVFSWFENSSHISYFAVFDGVSSSSGAVRGINIAAKSIKEGVIDQYKSNIFRPTELIFAANNRLLNCNIKNPYTTIALLAVPADLSAKCSVCNVGDTRVYSVTRQYVEKITTDHLRHAHKNILTQCLGVEDISPVEKCIADDFEDGLIFLICTDGFYRHVENDWLLILNSCFKRSLISIRNEFSKIIRGSDDDATYLLVKVRYV